MTKLSKQRVFAILLASIMTVNIASMSTFYATDEFVPTETNVTENVGTDGENINFQNAVPLSFSGEVTGSVEGQNFIYYKIKLPKDGALTLEFTHKKDTGDAKAELYSSDGNIQYDTIGSNSDDTLPTPEPKTYYLYRGTYYFRVRAWGGDNSDYTLKTSFKGINVNDNEYGFVNTPNNDYEHAQEISIGTAYRSIHAENQASELGDWYKFTLDKKTDLTLYAEFGVEALFDVRLFKATDEYDLKPEANQLDERVLGSGVTAVDKDKTADNWNISLDIGTYYINFGNSRQSRWYDFWLKEQGADDPEPLPQPALIEMEDEIPPDPKTDPTGKIEPITFPTEIPTPTYPTEPPTPTGPTVPPVTDPTKTTNPIPSPTPNPSNTTGGNSTNSNANTTNSNTSTTPGKVATGDTKSVIGLFSGLFATAGIIFASRKKRSTK